MCFGKKIINYYLYFHSKTIQKDIIIVFIIYNIII
jgi:hypothetical protein